LADDGDPLDALVWQETALPQGSVIVVRPVALARVTQVQAGRSRETQNDRVVALPAESEESFTLSASMREQLAQFLVRAAVGSGHEARVEGWYDANEAGEAIREAAHRYEATSRG
jgi:inorganic pyrophosphatase